LKTSLRVAQAVLPVNVFSTKEQLQQQNSGKYPIAHR